MADADGVLTGTGLSAGGVSRSVQGRLIRGGTLHSFSQSLFAVAPPTWATQLAAALRIGGADSLAYGTTSLALQGVGERCLPLYVLVPPTSHPRDREWVTFRRGGLNGRKALMNISPARVAFDDSVLDALDVLDEAAAIALVTRVIQERRTTAHRLLKLADGRARVPHRVVVGGLLRDGAGIESVLEYVHLNRVERSHGLEPMVRQYVVPETGHRADGAYPARRALIHLDGARYHDPDVDRDLDNRHSALGYTSFRFTWSDCWAQACATAARVTGGDVPRRCPRCPSAA